MPHSDTVVCLSLICSNSCIFYCTSTGQNTSVTLSPSSYYLFLASFAACPSSSQLTLFFPLSFSLSLSLFCGIPSIKLLFFPSFLLTHVLSQYPFLSLPIVSLYLLSVCLSSLRPNLSLSLSLFLPSSLRPFRSRSQSAKFGRIRAATCLQHFVQCVRGEREEISQRFLSL